MMRTALATIALALTACVLHPPPRAAQAPAGTGSTAYTPAATAPDPAPEAAPADRFVTMPDVVGLARAQAEAKIRAAGIIATINEPDNMGHVEGCAAPPDSVCETWPAAGQRTSPGDPVKLELQKAPSGTGDAP